MSSRCSFCSRLPGAGSYVVAGPRGVGICDLCAITANTVAQEALRPQGTDRLVTGIRHLMTNDLTWGGTLGIIDDAAVAIRKGRVAWVGEEQEIPRQLDDLPRLDCGGRVAVPGFVDAFCQIAGTAGGPESSPEGPPGETATEWAPFVALISAIVISNGYTTATINGRLSALESRVGYMEERLDTRMDRLESKMDALDKKFDQLLAHWAD